MRGDGLVFEIVQNLLFGNCVEYSSQTGFSKAPTPLFASETTDFHDADLVDAGGIEPPTCRLRVECSASLATRPLRGPNVGQHS